MALLAAAAVVGILVGVGVLLARRDVWRHPPSLGALGAHLGMALAALGIAFSGPYTQDSEMALRQGESGTVGAYTATLLELQEGSRPGYDFIAARLQVSKNGKTVGEVAPERLYDKFGNMQFSEVDVIPGLGNEVYASLLGLDGQSRVVVKVSVEPLVNWLWIGGTLMCFLPLLGLRRGKGRADGQGSGNAAPDGDAPKDTDAPKDGQTA